MRADAQDTRDVSFLVDKTHHEAPIGGIPGVSRLAS